MNRRNVKKKNNNPQTKINILCYEDFECIGIFFHNIFNFLAIIKSLIDFILEKVRLCFQV